LQRALGAPTPAAARTQLGHLIKPPVTAVALYDKNQRLVAAAGSSPPIAPALAAPTSKSGRQFGSLAVSVTTPSSFVTEVGGLTDLDVRLFTRKRRLASTLNESGPAAPPTSGKVKIGGTSYRGRFAELQEPVGPPVSIGVFTESQGIT